MENMMSEFEELGEKEDYQEVEQAPVHSPALNTVTVRCI